MAFPLKMSIEEHTLAWSKAVFLAEEVKEAAKYKDSSIGLLAFYRIVNELDTIARRFGRHEAAKAIEAGEAKQKA